MLAGPVPVARPRCGRPSPPAARTRPPRASAATSASAAASWASTSSGAASARAIAPGSACSALARNRTWASAAAACSLAGSAAEDGGVGGLGGGPVALARRPPPRRRTAGRRAPPRARPAPPWRCSASRMPGIRSRSASSSPDDPLADLGLRQRPGEPVDGLARRRRRRPSASTARRTPGGSAGWRRCRPWRAPRRRRAASASRSRTGESCLHGSHQVAHRSTTTGTCIERSMTSAWKVCSVTSKVNAPPPAGASPAGAALARDCASDRALTAARSTAPAMDSPAEAGAAARARPRGSGRDTPFILARRCHTCSGPGLPSSPSGAAPDRPRRLDHHSGGEPAPSRAR